jgi:hypothetical protein
MASIFAPSRIGAGLLAVPRDFNFAHKYLIVRVTFRRECTVIFERAEGQ